MKTRISKLFIALFLITVNITAQNLTEKANIFLESLSDDLHAKAVFSLDDEERYNMNYVPIPRKGPTFHDFNEVQKSAAIDLLKSSLGEEGFRKSQEIISLEKVLRIIENDDNDKMPDGRPRRDPLNYHFSIFGDPSSGNPWGWRFEGHHLSLNFTSTDNKVSSSTPTFFGTNPGIVKTTEFKGKEVLKKEAEMGFTLVNSLTEKQLKTALLSKEAPDDVLTLTKRKVDHLEPYGISYTKLNIAQKITFLQLIKLYLDNYEANFAADFEAKIEESGIENLHFSWAGSLKHGDRHYYRIQGPMLIIEYDNTQNNANHAHIAVRDLTNDYGEDVLKKHYEADHQH